MLIGVGPRPHAQEELAQSLVISPSPSFSRAPVVGFREPRGTTLRFKVYQPGWRAHSLSPNPAGGDFLVNFHNIFDIFGSPHTACLWNAVLRYDAKEALHARPAKCKLRGMYPKSSPCVIHRGDACLAQPVLNGLRHAPKWLTRRTRDDSCYATILRAADNCGRTRRLA